LAKNLTVRLDDDLAADTEALARAEGKSLNETVKLALSEAVERRRSDPAFTDRVRRIIEQDRELLERLAKLPSLTSISPTPQSRSGLVSTGGIQHTWPTNSPRSFGRSTTPSPQIHHAVPVDRSAELEPAANWQLARSAISAGITRPSGAFLGGRARRCGSGKTARSSRCSPSAVT
jgi:hypothetical protein